MPTSSAETVACCLYVLGGPGCCEATVHSEILAPLAAYGALPQAALAKTAQDVFVARFSGKGECDAMPRFAAVLFRLCGCLELRPMPPESGLVSERTGTGNVVGGVLTLKSIEPAK